MAEAMRQALLESGCIDVEHADQFQVSGDPDAAENTWHSVSQRKYSTSQWDKTEPEWMRERAYKDSLHPSQSNLTMANADMASELTQMVQPATSSNKGLWIGLAAAVVVLLGVIAFVLLRPPPETPDRPVVQPRTRIPARRVKEPAVQPATPVTPPRRDPDDSKDPDDSDDSDDSNVTPRRPVGPRVRPRHPVRRFRPVLLLDSSPQGAEVWVGSRKMGNTPYRLPGRVGRTVRWTIKHSGFKPQSGHWRYTRSRLSRNKVQLQRQLVSVWIQSKPAQAYVFVEGRKVGMTPYRYQGPVGASVAFTLKKDKFQVYKGRVKLGAQPSRRTFTLKPFINDPFNP
jgi:hypothetical protein